MIAVLAHVILTGHKGHEGSACQLSAPLDRSQHPSKHHEPFSPQQCCLSHCAQTGLALAHAGQDCSMVARGNKVTHSIQKAEEKA